MVGAGKYKVRPLKTEGTDLKKIFKVNISARALTIHGLKPDDWCQLSSASGLSFLVQVWPAPLSAQDTWIQISDDLRYRNNLNLGDEVYLSRCAKPIIPNADDVVVSDCQEKGLESLEDWLVSCWTSLIKFEFKQAGLLSPGMIFTVRAMGEERAFRINSINRSDRMAPHQYAAHLTVTIASKAVDTSIASKSDVVGRPAYLEAATIGGLDAQVAHLNSVIARYASSAKSYKLTSTHRTRRGAVLIHGPSGTGKRTLLRMVAELGCWTKTYNINDVMKGASKNGMDAAIRQMFEEARRCQPSAIIIDRLDVYARKSELTDDSQSSSTVGSLCEALDARDDNRVLVVAAARNLALVDESLRHPGRFETDIEIPVPGTEARAQILNLAFRSPRDSRDEQLLRLADSTHGYVGSDLKQLLDTIMDQAFLRLEASRDDKEDAAIDRLGTKDSTFTELFTDDDIQTALLKVKPTAMKEIFLDTPRVKWEDIGGQDEIKKALRKAIEWPLKYRSLMEQRGLRPKKGLLLYGPPGCSKTLVAKAVATEAKVNFLAVKGAELLSMYVGESERAVREVFRKARGAAPSIIFFDEIDSIGASRVNSPQGGLHVLTTLLNELDGIEALKGVFVLAATNQPKILDPALLRPGRIGSSLYVGLPDCQTRREIIAIETRQMCLDPKFDAADLAVVTGGYSGVELVEICQQAGYAAYGEELESGQDQAQAIGMRHFNGALKEITKQVTPEMVRGYEEWRDRGQVKVNRNEESAPVGTSMSDIVATIAQLLLDSCKTE
ncbi:MAG: hypothetical protein Q9221_005720 [Calogaya cf. arnoldii]